MTEQLYLLRLCAMNTCDECDIVPSAEFIVDKDFGTNEHSAMDALIALQRQLNESLVGAPVTNIRPMTRNEIEVWRDAE
jgi:hypothetical protein